MTSNTYRLDEDSKKTYTEFVVFYGEHEYDTFTEYSKAKYIVDKYKKGGDWSMKIRSCIEWEVEEI